MIRVAVLIPTTGRAAQMKELVGELLAQQMPEGVRMTVYLSVPSDDGATLKAAWLLGGNRKVLERAPGTTAVEGWNLAYRTAVGEGEEWFVLGADDIRWQEGWLETALQTAWMTGKQVIGLNDGGHTDLAKYAPHYMIHWQFIDLHLDGVFISPEYRSWWFDREICDRARRLGQYVACWGAWAEHLHPDWGTAEMDETYAGAWASHDADRLVYLQRMEL